MDFNDIPTSPCDQNKLLGAASTEDDSIFYDLNDSSSADAHIYAPKMMCATNLEDLKIQGSFDASKAENLMLVFEKCNKSWSPVEC